MSARVPLIRARIQDFYRASVEFDGTSYTLRDDSGLVLTNALIMGFVTTIEESVNRDGLPLYHLLIDDSSGSIWVYTADEVLIHDIQIWDQVEVIGTIEFQPEEDGKRVVLLVRPSHLAKISSAYQEFVHYYDWRKQKKIMPSFASRAPRTFQRVPNPGFSEEGSRYGGMNESSSDKRGHRGEISTADEANDQPLARNGPESLEDKIITIIKTMDSGSGVSLEDIVNSLEKSSKVNIDAVENLIFDLQMQGTIFEPSWRTYKYSS